MTPLLRKNAALSTKHYAHAHPSLRSLPSGHGECNIIDTSLTSGQSCLSASTRSQCPVCGNLSSVTYSTVSPAHIHKVCCLLGFSRFVSSHHQTAILVLQGHCHQPDRIYCQLVAPNTPLGRYVCPQPPVTRVGSSAMCCRMPN